MSARVPVFIATDRCEFRGSIEATVEIAESRAAARGGAERRGARLALGHGGDGVAVNLGECLGGASHGHDVTRLNGELALISIAV